MLPPVQIAVAEGVTVTVGAVKTVIVNVAVLVQPPLVVPVMVYVVVEVAEQTTLAPVVALKPVAGNQV